MGNLPHAAPDAAAPATAPKPEDPLRTTLAAAVCRFDAAFCAHFLAACFAIRAAVTRSIEAIRLKLYLEVRCGPESGLAQKTGAGNVKFVSCTARNKKTATDLLAESRSHAFFDARPAGFRRSG